MRGVVLIAGGAALYALVCGSLLLTGGAPGAIFDAPAAIARLGSENAWALPAMGAILFASGALAFGLATRRRKAGAIAVGAAGAYVGGFSAFWLANDLTGALLVAQLAFVWSWMAILAGAALPLLALWASRRA